MNFETFSGLLFGVSVTTALVTEGIKKYLQENNKEYKANALAGGVAVGLSVLAEAGYLILTETNFDAKTLVWFVALAFGSWLCSMFEYDKVIQTLEQFKKVK